jgi:hypothetical protein
MKALFLGLLLTSGAWAENITIKCEAQNIKITVVESAKKEIFVTYGLESALADGIVNKDEVDLIAKFPQSGEMTLVAKIGKTNTQDNYLFFMGKRNTVICK